jgi:hypothetical protein
VRFHADHSRTYATDPENLPCVVRGQKLLPTDALRLPTIPQPSRIAGRMFDSFRPLVAAAVACGDAGFWALVKGKLETETLALRDAQAAEPEALVVTALIDCMSGVDKNHNDTPLNFTDYVPLKNLAASIWDNHRISLRPEQIGAIARDLGFQVRLSHGITKIAPTSAALVRAAEEVGVDDEAITDLKQQLMKEGTKRTG